MSSDGGLSWRDRAIAQAALGAATVSRAAFVMWEPRLPSPLAMQVLVALALREGLRADAPERTDLEWLRVALRIETDVLDEIVRRLVTAAFVRHRVELEEEIRWELDVVDDAEVTDALPIEVTPAGWVVVGDWLHGVRPQFSGWPPDRHEVDDATA